MDTGVPGLNVLSQMLDAAALRHRVIAQNIANVNTPGYKRREVAFEAELSKALANPDVADTAHVKPKVVLTEGLPERVDGNNVDIDQEMNQLTKNALLYQAAAQIIASRVGSLRAAITGR